MKKKTAIKKKNEIQGTGVRRKSTRVRKPPAETSGVASNKAGPPHGAARQKQTAPAGVQWHQGVIVDHAILKSWPNVQRVELGWKERGGKITGRAAVKIYVTEKKPGLSPLEMLPKTARVLLPVGKGMYKMRRLPTDVVWHAEASFLAAPFAPPGSFFNPVPGGVSVGVPGSQVGTYTCLVANAQGNVFAVTAGHVIQAFQGQTTSGLQVFQPPSPAPNGNPLFAVTNTGFFGNAPNGAGFLDFALMDIDPARSALSDPLDHGPLVRQVMSAAFVVNNKIPMTKFGAATGRTFGVFSAPVTTIVIAGVVVTKVLEFIGAPGQMFATGGDSGALAVSDAAGSQGEIIGILFAATGPTPDAPSGRGYVMPFERLTGLRPV
jgi:hypothetical protein